MVAGSPELAAAESLEVQGTGLRSRQWKRFLRGPDQTLLNDLYVPALSHAIRYDRCCSYFSSTVLAAAARGFGKLIERLIAMGDEAPRPAVRLVVNEELARDDVKALIETGDTKALEKQLLERLEPPKEALEKERLQMLGWLAKCGLLELRVGLMRFGEGIVHAKFGLAVDEADDAIVFSGSGNESAQGLIANYERLEVSTSWEDPERFQEYGQEFESLWQDDHPDVHTVSLPEAVRLSLIKFAPSTSPIIEPSNAQARQKAAMVWRLISEAPYLENGAQTCDSTAMVDLWPHQRRVVEETAAAWPSGRLLCDEVGLGKTLEAVFVLRRLMAGRGVQRALILLPAGLLKQWQSELREKGGMIFPRLEGLNVLVWPGGREKKVAGLSQALEENVLLMSRETARTENNIPILLTARPWDLVVLDEAHVARRREQQENEFNSATLLLMLLRELQLRQQTRAFMLISATPMQTNPWEPWDLLGVLGEGGACLADFANVRNFYLAISGLKNGFLSIETARKASEVIAADPKFPFPPSGLNMKDSGALSRTLAFAPPSQRSELTQWLRTGSPLARRMHRNTHTTLKRYYEMGLLSDPPPRRRLKDIVFEYQDLAERQVYESITEYIERRYEELEREKPGKGFVMTVYRRRAASSPHALERSLKRRRELLLRVAERRAYDPNLSAADLSEYLDPFEIPEGDRNDHVSSAVPQDAAKAREELTEVDQLLSSIQMLGGRDSKRDHFFDELRRASDDGRSILVFTEYADTLEYIREALVTSYGSSLGCYSGAGGAVWDGSEWKHVSKAFVSEALFKGEIRILICTDAASEGLNLQAAGAVINYDLPWNPARVEQRIGRIDRIGQKHAEVLIANLFLKDSVDRDVYKALQTRCGLFEHFVGAMQPVLAKASRILLGALDKELPTLHARADQVDADPLAEETYLESSAGSPPQTTRPALTTQDMTRALSYLTESLGFRVRSNGDGRYTVLGTNWLRGVFSTDLKTLEQDEKVRPLTPFDPIVEEIVETLSRPGERLPLVIGSYRKGAFRASAAYWVRDKQSHPIGSVSELEQALDTWGGAYPDAESWQRANQIAKASSKEVVDAFESAATAIERDALDAQLASARLRVLRELGKYLVCLEVGSSDLNQILYQQMSRDTASAARLRQCLEKLGGYPDWPDNLRSELDDFIHQTSPNQRKAVLLGSPLEAALQDPRWEAAKSLAVA